MTNDRSLVDEVATVDVEFVAEARTRGKLYVQVRIGSEIVHEDTVNLESDSGRSKFLRKVLQRLRDRGVEKTEADLEHQMRSARSECICRQTRPNDTETAYSVFEVAGSDFGLYRAGETPQRIMNCIPQFISDVTIQDAGECSREFRGTLRTSNTTSEWKISADDYANDAKLKASLYAAAGPNLIIDCRMDELRNAIAQMSTPSQEIQTTDFGWTEQGDFLTPGAIITTSGWRTTGNGHVTVNMESEDIPRQLGLLEPIPEQVERLKRDVVPRLLGLQHLRVMLPLIGFVWVPILVRFLPDARPFCLWLAGETGVGKSYIARLMQRFYGDFSKYLSWASTVNSLQRAGYFFKNALVLIDDYKPDIVNSRDVTRFIQTYADGSARGRLKKDATSNWSREVRGWMISTGEDLPEHSSSTLARMVIVRAPRHTPNLDDGRLCKVESQHFSQLTSAFIASVIREGRGPLFRQEVEQFELDFQSRLAGQQNGPRIGRNFAILQAATRQAVEFLVLDPLEQNRLLQSMSQLIQEMITDVVHETIEQAPHEILFSNLRSMLVSGRVHIQGVPRPAWDRTPEQNRGVNIGRVCPENANLIQINLTEALRMVNESLRAQSKTELKATNRTLLNTMRQAQILVGIDGQILGSEESPTRQAAINDVQGTRNLHCFTIRRELLGISAASSIGALQLTNP